MNRPPPSIGALLIAICAGCSEPTAAPVATDIHSLQVAPGVVRLLAGDSMRFTAVVRDLRGSDITAPGLSWSSRNTHLVSVTSAGVAHASALGEGAVEDSTWIIVTGTGADTVD